MATGLNNVFKLSGSSVLPAYPGFIVMNIPKSWLRWIVFPPNKRSLLFFPSKRAYLMVSTC